MANIAEDLMRIQGARYGRDVRDSIHDAIYDINEESVDAKTHAITAQDSAINSANRAEQYASNAQTSANNADGSATTAGNKATLAESWAVGGTGTRSGEDTNNAKYWSEVAESAVTGVVSFNGRQGAVTPASGDYSIDQISNSGTSGQVAISDGNGHMTLTSTGQANGIASLDGNGRVPYSQLPESAMEFKGTWNANTNTPTLTSGLGTNGDFYVVSVAGTWNNIAFNVNDRILFDDVTAHDWIRLAAGEVNSVNGQSGAVQLDADDIPFDGTGSVLVSTNIEAAIKEVLTKAGAKVVTVTMAYYLAHKAELDASDDIIVISDSGTANSASNVSYDNTSSGLTAESVQGAIDEVNGALTKYSFGTVIDIKGQTSYLCPSDGYVKVQMIGTTTGVNGIIDANNETLMIVPSGISYETHSVYVKKGMVIKDRSTSTNYNLVFIPLT